MSEKECPCSELKQVFKDTDRLDQDVEKSLSIENNCETELSRNGFARDRDRILFTRAFRRLQHKKQIFPNGKGDHFRTRLTHTMETAQIARSLARYLCVDEDLAEAIALGHDIGHTPFGHQGEDVLDDIMRGKDDLGEIKIPLNHGGFKHNYNSVKILDITESKFENFSGLNLSWQVLEGILKHTNIKKDQKEWDIKRFVNEKRIKNLFLERDSPVTLEGQIVNIADEIAQRQHDIDDGLRGTSPIIKIDEVYDAIINYEVKDSLNGKRLFDNFVQMVEKNRESNELFKKESLIRNIIDYFIHDVVVTTKYNCLEYQHNKILYTTRKFVNFSAIADGLDKNLESYIKKQIINSYDVNKSNGRSKYIIRQLFKAYYNNPLQMPHYILERLEKKIEQNSKDCIIKLKGNGKCLNEIKFKNGDQTDINSLLSILKLENLDDKITNQEVVLTFLSSKTEDELKRINSNRSKNLTSEYDKFLKCLLENNYAYLSTICDYIAGMSDNYAEKEFKDLYLVI
jgi:dGTPase